MATSVFNEGDLSGDKVNISDIANNLTTTDAGKVLDARQGKTLKTAVDGKAAKFTVSRTVTRKNITTSWAYTGLSVSIPAGCAYGIQVRQNYNNAYPTCSALLTASDTFSGQNAILGNDGGWVSTSGYNNNAVNYYVWCKAAASGGNDIDVNYWYCKI